MELSEFKLEGEVLLTFMSAPPPPPPPRRRELSEGRSKEGLEVRTTSEAEAEASSGPDQRQRQPVDATHEGDLELYTHANYQTRRAIAVDPTFEEQVHRLWHTRGLGLDAATGAPCDLGRDAWISLVIKLHILIIAPPVCRQRAMLNALDDWERDTHKWNERARSERSAAE